MGWKAIKEHYRIDHAVAVVPGKGICIGSPYVHDLITIDDDANVIIGKLGVRPGEKLDRYREEMEADRAKLKAIIAQPDTFERSIAVFTYQGADIIECACEELGWPNVTHDGRMMYENMFSTDRAEVVDWAIRSARSSVEAWTENVARRQDELAETQQHLDRVNRNLTILLQREAPA
jgi:uncharacterized Zn finger protein (UPF0148 family)